VSLFSSVLHLTSPVRFVDGPVLVLGRDYFRRFFQVIVFFRLSFPSRSSRALPAVRCRSPAFSYNKYELLVAYSRPFLEKSVPNG